MSPVGRPQAVCSMRSSQGLTWQAHLGTDSPCSSVCPTSPYREGFGARHPVENNLYPIQIRSRPCSKLCARDRVFFSLEVSVPSALCTIPRGSCDSYKASVRGRREYEHTGHSAGPWGPGATRSDSSGLSVTHL